MSIQAYQLSGAGQASIPNAPISSPRSPTTTDVVSPAGNPYQLLQPWKNTVTGAVFEYAGNGLWVEVVDSGGGGPITTLTGNTGGAISPVAGNINIVGGDTTTVAGSGNTLTVTTTASGYPITPFVVGPAGKAGYQTVQSAITAAAAAGGGSVYVQKGTYTENLTLANGVDIVGDSFNVVTITGVHTPPATGEMSFENITLTSATHIFSSAVAGSANLSVDNCEIIVTNGFLFNLANWTGTLSVGETGSSGTSDGFVNNTGGSAVIVNASQAGAGTGQTMVSTGAVQFLHSEILCPVNFQTGAALTAISSSFAHTVTFSNNSTATVAECIFSTGATAAIVQSSSAAITVTNTTITSSNNPAVDGAGAGTLVLGDVIFTSNTAIAATLTLGTTDLVSASSYRTTPLATNVTLSGNTLSATGSDTNISINVTPKGTGSVIYSASRAAADLNYQATNSDNTSGTSNAGFQSAVGGASAGDPYTQYAVSGVTTWTTGIDNSASDAYVIAASNALGTSNAASWSTAGALTNTAGITASTGNITATAGNFVAVVAGSGLVLPVTTASGATPQVADARVGSVTFTGISIAAAADLTLVITNSAITGASTVVLYSMRGFTTGSACSIKSVTNSAGSSSIVVTNGTGATTTTADITFDFIVLN